MSGVNKVFFAGHLGRDPQMRQTPGGKQVANASIAHTRSWGDQNENKETTWVDLEAWGGWAAALGRFKKGSYVIVEGRLKLDTWTDKDTNQQRSKLLVSVEAVLNPLPKPQDGAQGGQQTFGDAYEPPEHGGQQGAPQRPQYTPQQRQAPAAPAPQQGGGMFSAGL